jgi:rhamnose transport system substrate-binding protein
MRSASLPVLSAIVGILLFTACERPAGDSPGAAGPPDETTGTASAAGGKTLTIGVMPKLKGIDYFNAVEQGAQEAAKELGVKVFYEGPVTDDVTRQAEMLDGWIARKMDVIAVAPNDPHALAPTLRKAAERGIKAITYDADSDEDSRAYFVNQATAESIGVGLVDVMAEQIGGQGDVAIITGSLTAANQNAWMEFMRKHAAGKYPGMNIVTVKPSQEDQQIAFQVAQDLLKAYPNLKGIFGITSVALPGAAEAVRQSGFSGKVAVTGLSTPKSMKKYVDDGTVKVFLLWNPVDLGYLTVFAAKAVAEEGELGETLTAGRLGDIEVSGTQVLLGPPIRFTSENIDQFDF